MGIATWYVRMVSPWSSGWLANLSQLCHSTYALGAERQGWLRVWSLLCTYLYSNVALSP